MEHRKIEAYEDHIRHLNQQLKELQDHKDATFSMVERPPLGRPLSEWTQERIVTMALRSAGLEHGTHP